MNVPWWKGTTDIYLATGSLIIIWFVAQRVPWRFHLPIDALTATHVVTASLFALFCAAQVFHTPSHGPMYRKIHIWLGRATMIIGVVSIISGMLMLLRGGALQLLGLASFHNFSFATASRLTIAAF